MDLRVNIIFLIVVSRGMCLNIITFTIEPKDTFVTKDGVNKVMCKVNQIGVRYGWIKVKSNNQSIIDGIVAPSPHISVDQVGGVLIVRHHQSIVGRYRCKAFIAGVGAAVSRLFRINIEDLYFNKMTQKQLGSGGYRIGDRALLICPFWMVPLSQAEFKWFIRTPNGRRQIKYSKTWILHHNGKLLEMKVEGQSFGSYHCEAIYNKYGLERTGPDIDIHHIGGVEDSRRNSQLMWVAKPIESLLLERTEIYSEDVKVVSGSGTIVNLEGTKRLELVCVANSENNDHEITWLKDGVLMDRAPYHSDRIDYEITGQGTLVLRNTTTHYSGEYTCKAVLLNKQMAIETSLVITVRPQLRFTNKATTIIILNENKEIVLSCRINDQYSQTPITWTKNGEVISSNNNLQQEGGFLRISRLIAGDEGIFQCLVDHEFSSLQAGAEIKANKAQSYEIRDYRPLPVRNLRVRVASYRTLNISWSHAIEDFGNILHYEIVLLDLSDLSPSNNKIIIKADRLESSVLVENLIPDSFYRIYVSAVNGSGTSFPAMIKSSPRVLSKAPSVSPTEVKVVDIGIGVATVHWSPPQVDKMNGELLRYRLLIASVDGIYSKSINVDKTSQMFQISDLIPNTRYSVRIQALTRGGIGPLSPSVSFDTSHSTNKYDLQFRHKTPDNPHSNADLNPSKEKMHLLQTLEISNLRVKGSNTSIFLQWSHPINGGSIRKYRITWGKVYPGPNEIIITYPSSSYVIENLDMGTQYMIKITPVNDAGDGKELLFSQFTGSVDFKKIPIPLNLEVKGIGIDSAIISWEDPSSDFSGTRLYQIRYKVLDKDSLTASLKNTSETDVKIAGLLPFTSYACSVRTGDIFPSRDHAAKEWIWSEWSLKVTFKTIGEEPKDSVRDFTIATVGMPDIRENDVYTNVIISWSSPYRRSSRKYDEIIGYSVLFTDNPQLDQEKWNVQILSKDQFSSQVNLNGKGKIYYFRVGCRTLNFQCPLSRYILYKTADGTGLNYGILQVPEQYHYTLDIPTNYLYVNPHNSPESELKLPESLSRDLMWLIAGISFGALVFLMMLVVIIFIFCRRSKSQLLGYKLGRKSSGQHVSGSGLLLSNHSPVVLKGKVSPNFMSASNKQLKNPDLFPHLEQNYGDPEIESNQDNDSMRFASVSQNHIACATTCSNMFNPNIHIRSNHQIVFYPEMSAQAKTNPGTVVNPMFNMNSSSIPKQISERNLQQMRHHNIIYPFTQHLINSGSTLPACSSTCLQPNRISPKILPNQPHEVKSPANTPRVNAGELTSQTSFDDIGAPLVIDSNGDAPKLTGRSNKMKVINSSHKVSVDSGRNSNMPKGGSIVKEFINEDLSLEISNLEGLMKDLNTITQKEFEC